MPEQQPLLVLDHLSAGYLDQPVVRDVSLEVYPRTISSLIGGNGAGKSTLLKSLFGLVKWLSGEIVLNGEPIQHLSPPERMRRGIGIVPQGRCNFPQMTVRENLEMGAYTLERAAARQACERVVALFPILARKWNELAGNLSGGEQQILETAMVLETDPILLLLDEPSLGLSPKMQQDVFDHVDGLRQAGVTVIMAEQNVLGSLVISDRAIVLDLGTKFLEGSAREVMYDPKIRAAYLGGDPRETEDVE